MTTTTETCHTNVVSMSWICAPTTADNGCSHHQDGYVQHRGSTGENSVTQELHYVEINCVRCGDEISYMINLGFGVE